MASKARAGRQLRADNAALLQDLADLQHSNRDLARQLAAATNQLANFGVHFTTSSVASSLTAAVNSGSGKQADANGDGAVLSKTAADGLGVPSRPGSAAAADISGSYVPSFLTAGGSRPTSPG